MLLAGYCESCRKIKRVRVSNAAMVRVALNKPVFGICDTCDELALAAARDRHPSGRSRP